jgi:hypothetical protein
VGDAGEAASELGLPEGAAEGLDAGEVEAVAGDADQVAVRGLGGAVAGGEVEVLADATVYVGVAAHTAEERVLRIAGIEAEADRQGGVGEPSRVK